VQDFLTWFHNLPLVFGGLHITMRITTLKQMAKPFTSLEGLKDAETQLEKIKWYLWHGNTFHAL
jgi:hypothetical protein